MSFTVFQTSCLCHCLPVVPLLLLMIACLCCRCCINKVELNWTVEQPKQWNSIRLMKVVLSFPSVVNLHFGIENCNLLKLHFSNQTISTWFSKLNWRFSLQRCRLLLSLPVNKREPRRSVASASPPLQWVQRLLQNPRAEVVSSAAAARVNSAAFSFTFQKKSIPVWRTATPSCQTWTSHWRQRCMKSELASLLPVAMATAAFAKCPPTWGNSQVSPGNQNGSFYLHRNMKRVDPRAPVLDPCPVPVLRGLSLTGCRWIRACSIAGRCRSRLSRLFLEWRSIGPSSLDSWLPTPWAPLITSLSGVYGSRLLFLHFFSEVLNRYQAQTR